MADLLYSQLPTLFVRDHGEEAVPCAVEETDFDSHQPLRIVSIFVIFAGSLLGAAAPVFFHQLCKVHSDSTRLLWALFVCKYFGSGVIIGTAWMHLMSPATAALGDPCLESRLGDYDWAMAISLITILVMFGIEMLIQRLNPFEPKKVSRADSSAQGGSSLQGVMQDHSSRSDVDRNPTPATASLETIPASKECPERGPSKAPSSNPSPTPPSTADRHQNDASAATSATATPTWSIPGLDIEAAAAADKQTRGGARYEVKPASPSTRSVSPERTEDNNNSLRARLASLAILEFGIIFHSIFIGLMLAVAGNFVTLFVVIVFHQVFEGLGLGSRLATMQWSKKQTWVPYGLSLLYALSTPMAIAAGLGIKEGMEQTSPTSRLINGIFDSISGGILMYTGLVELLAHEFMFSPEMKEAKFGIQLGAYGLVCLGVGIMATLAKWA